MKTDPITAEVRKHRQAILEAHDWDISKLIRHMTNDPRFKNRKVIPAPPKSKAGILKTPL
jgi:hypothetical protein